MVFWRSFLKIALMSILTIIRKKKSPVKHFYEKKNEKFCFRTRGKNCRRIIDPERSDWFIIIDGEVEKINLTFLGGGTGLPMPWSEHMELKDSLLRPLLSLDELGTEGAGGGGFRGLCRVELFILSIPKTQEKPMNLINPRIPIKYWRMSKFPVQQVLSLFPSFSITLCRISFL